MRAAPLLVALAALLAGCAGSYPTGSRVLTEVEVGTLGAGAEIVHNFTLSAPAGFLAVGYRVGPARELHVALRDPAGALWDAAGGEPPGPCAVRAPAAGPWALVVRTGPANGSVAGGKFTVRAADGAPPPLFACVDDRFPGRGRLVTLGAWEANLTAGAFEASFGQPWELSRLRARAAEGAPNLTLAFVPPDGPEAGPEVASPPQGTWRVVARLAQGAEPGHATLLVEGFGA